MTPGQKIKQYRKEHNLTQAQLAKKLDISRPYMSEIESDKRNMSFKTINNFAKKLGVSSLELFDTGNDYIETDSSSNFDKQKKPISSQLLGEKIISIRIQSHLSQQEFADRINELTNSNAITKTIVNEWETGKNRPNEPSQTAIAKIGNMTRDELIYDEYGWKLWESATGRSREEIEKTRINGIETGRINTDDSIQKQIGKATQMLEFNGSPDLNVIHEIDSSLRDVGNQIDTYYVDPKKWETAPTFGNHHIIPRNGNISDYFYDDMNKDINLDLKKIIKDARTEIIKLGNKYHLNDTNHNK